MAKDVVVVVNLDTMPRPAEVLDILLISTEGAVPINTYRSLTDIQVAFPDKRIANKAAALFNQGRTTLADSLIRRVKIVGFAQPDDSDALVQDIETLQDIDNDWYVFMTDQDGDDFVQALAQFAELSEPTEAELGAGAEDMRKFYFGQTDNLALVGKYARSAIIYVDTENLLEEADAAWVGNVGPFYPRYVTWKFKRPDRITRPDISDSQRASLAEANVNFLTEEYKKQYVKNGTCWNGEFIDVVLGADYITQYMREELYNVFLSNEIIPYDDNGFAIVASAVFAALNRAVELGIIASDSGSGAGIYSVIVPARASATDEQASNRQMPDIIWDAQISGAVHGVKTRGTLRVTL